jgi:hypothetical protein
VNREADRQIVQVDVTIVLSRRVVWLLAGIAIGSLGSLPGALLEKATQIVRAVLAG